MDLSEAVKAHSDWKLKLRAAMSARSALDASTITKDNCCALGKWLHGESRARFGRLPSHAECVRVHAEFHRQAGKVALAINAGRYIEAERLLEAGSPYSSASNAVVIAINAMKREASL
jgi:methyl-accepting chemotaxis protein